MRNYPNKIIAERLSARQLILRRISEIVCMYNMYPSHLGIQLFRALTRKRSITCASVMLRNVTALLAIEVRWEKSSAYNYSAGHRRRCTHTTQWRPAYSCSVQPISSALYLYIPAAETLRQWRETCAQHLDIRCARHSTVYAYL